MACCANFGCDFPPYVDGLCSLHALQRFYLRRMIAQQSSRGASVGPREPAANHRPAERAAKSRPPRLELPAVIKRPASTP